MAELHEALIQPADVPSEHDDDDAAERRLAVAQRLRGLRGPQPDVSAQAAEGEPSGLSELCERYHVLTMEALANPTELGTAAPIFSRVLRICSSRPLCGAITPLWALACVGPQAHGPAELLSLGIECLAAVAAASAIPMKLWVMWLNSTWPAAYGSCLREKVCALRPHHSSSEDEEACKPPLEIGEVAEESSCEEQVSESIRPAGARLLQLSGGAFLPLVLLGILCTTLLYVRDASRLHCRADYDDAVEYPWRCTWASAAWLATRICQASVLFDVTLAAAMLSAQCFALRAAAKASDNAQEISRLVDDAHAIWRTPIAGLVLISSIAVILAAAATLLHWIALHKATVLIADPSRAFAALGLALTLLACPLILVADVNAALKPAKLCFVHRYITVSRLPFLFVFFALSACVVALLLVAAGN